MAEKDDIGYQGIDLNDFDDETGETSDKSSTSDEKSSASASPQKEKGNGHVADHKGSKKKLIIFFVSFVAIIAILFLIINGNQKSKTAPGNTNQPTKTVSSSNSSTKKPKEIFADNSKSQSTKTNLTNQWRNATITYSKDNNSDKFIKAIKKIDTDRQTANYNINDSTSNTAKVLGDAFSKMHDGLGSAEKSKNSNEAIEIFNNWATKDKDYNEQYFESFKKDLNAHNIKYTLKKTNNSIEITY